MERSGKLAQKQPPPQTAGSDSGEGKCAGEVGRGICQRSAPGHCLSSVFTMRIAKVPKCFLFL